MRHLWMVTLLAFLPAVPALGTGDEPVAPPAQPVVSLHFEDSDLSDVVRFLQEITKYRFELTNDVRELQRDEPIPVGLALHEVPLDRALSLICLAAHPRLSWRSTGPRSIQLYLVENVSAVEDRADLGGREQEADDVFMADLDARLVDFNFDETPLPEVAQFVQELLNIPVVLTARARWLIEDEAPTVTVRIAGTALSGALDLVSESDRRFTWTVSHEAIVFDANYERPLPEDDHPHGK